MGILSDRACPRERDGPERKDIDEEMAGNPICLGCPGCSGLCLGGRAKRRAGPSGSGLVKDGYLYTMLYQESAEKDNRNVVKINTADNSQTVLPIEVNKFWLVSDGIVYVDFSTGKLMKSDFDGQNAKVLVDKKIDLIKAYGDHIYDTVEDEAGIYHTDAVAEKTEKLSNIVVNDILLNQSGCYFINYTYEAGIFKISGSGAVKIADGFVQWYINTDGGILYNKRGSTEMYLAK